jgi:hypothetical protein
VEDKLRQVSVHEKDQQCCRVMESSGMMGFMVLYARERERDKDKLPSENDWPQNVICILHIS